MKYFILFKDSFSKFRYVFVMKEESDALESLKIVSAYTKTLGHSVKELLSVNAKEFFSKEFEAVLRSEGTIHRLTAPYTSEQSGCSERENRPERDGTYITVFGS